ncbi:hypothetical protein HOY82DRAFT_582462 [Tuber indicum]|nr:hypothetical protein HOY82DRAFT_582462 [Tuber indicum]
MSSCGLGSWARVCAVGYPANSIQSQHARSPPGGTTHHKPCETLPYPPAFPLSFDSHTNVLG